MKMFKDVVGKKYPTLFDKYVCLEKCCEHFGLKSNNYSYHNALFDAFMTARMICKLYELIDEDPFLKKQTRRNPNSFNIKENPELFLGNSQSKRFNKEKENMPVLKLGNISNINTNIINESLNTHKEISQEEKIKINSVSPEKEMKDTRLDSLESTGGEDESSADRNKEEKLDKENENDELSGEILDEILNDLI